MRTELREIFNAICYWQSSLFSKKKALNIADHPELPAIVRVELWFGLEQYQSNWTAREQREGDFGVLAETVSTLYD